MLLAFIIEPLICGIGLDDFSAKQMIIHWIATCAIWGIAAFLLLLFAKRKFDFDIFYNKTNIKTVA